MSAGYAVPAAYMTAEVYRGTLVSKGAICPRVDEKVDGEYQLDVEIPCGAFDNVADIFNLSLSFQSGKPISLSCWLHPLPSARSVSEAHIRIARLNSIGYPFAVVIGEDGIRAVALGYLPVPETAQLDLPVSEEMRELSAETNSIIEALVPLASHADAIFAGIEEGDGKAISSNAITVDDALLLLETQYRLAGLLTVIARHSDGEQPPGFQFFLYGGDFLAPGAHLGKHLLAVAGAYRQPHRTDDRERRQR